MSCPTGARPAVPTGARPAVPAAAFLAVPVESPQPAGAEVVGDVVAGAYAALLAEVDDEERTSAPVSTWVATDLEQLLAAVKRPTVPRTEPVHPDPKLADHLTGEPGLAAMKLPEPPLRESTLVRSTLPGATLPGSTLPGPELPAPRLSTPALPRAVAAAPRPHGGARASSSDGWDRANLYRLGVPEQVLARLPGQDPSGAAAWCRALRTAVAASIPAPVLLGPEHPVVIDGYGLEGVCAILRGAVERRGEPGRIALGSGVWPATPAALVEVLAACLRS